MATRMWRSNGPIISVEGRKGYFDISYGKQSESQKLDVYLPEGNGPFPIIISIHGGGFIACDKRQKDMIDPMLTGLERGYAIVAVNYRLAEECLFPEPVKDIKRAIRFIKANADQWGLNAEKMVLWGGSAGGYMSLMGCLFAQETLFDSEDDPNLLISAEVEGGVIWYPVTDFTVDLDEELRINNMIDSRIDPEVKDVHKEYEPAFPISDDAQYPYHNLEGSAMMKFLGHDNCLDKEIVAKASPITYISEKMPPLLIQHGKRDQIVPVQQSVRLTYKANDLCGEERVKLEIHPYAIHSSVLFETQENISRIYEFIDMLIKKQ